MYAKCFCRVSCTIHLARSVAPRIAFACQHYFSWFPTLATHPLVSFRSLHTLVTWQHSTRRLNELTLFRFTSWSTIKWSNTRKTWSDDSWPRKTWRSWRTARRIFEWIRQVVNSFLSCIRTIFIMLEWKVIEESDNEVIRQATSVAGNLNLDKTSCPTSHAVFEASNFAETMTPGQGEKLKYVSLNRTTQRTCCLPIVSIGSIYFSAVTFSNKNCYSSKKWRL